VNQNQIKTKLKRVQEREVKKRD